MHTGKFLKPKRRTPVDRYMGLDPHVSSCTLARWWQSQGAEGERQPDSARFGERL
jgi:hypothetical protein